MACRTPSIKHVRRGWITLSKNDVQYELGMTLDGNKAVAIAQVRVIIGTNALLLLTDESPYLIAFISRTGTVRIWVAIARSQRSPASTSSFGIVVR